MAGRITIIMFTVTLFCAMGMFGATTPTTYSCTNPYTGVPAQQISIINTGIETGIFLSSVALMFFLMLIAIGYMISKAFGSSTLRNLLNTEYFEFAKSVMIVVVLLLGLTLVSNIAAIVDGVAVGTGSTYVTNIGGVAASAYTYLCQTQTAVGTGLNNIAEVSIAVGIIKSLKVSYQIPIPIGFFGGLMFGFADAKIYSTNFIDASSSTGANASIVNDLLTVVTIPLLFLITFEIIFLPEAIVLGLAVLIPIGLVLRAIPVFRPTGGALIAIGIGIALVYPAMLALFNAPISSAFTTAAGNALVTPATTNACSGCTWLEKAAIAVFDNLPLKDIGIAALSINSIYYPLNLLLENNVYAIFQFLLFILDIAIAVPVTSTIASLMGGRLQTGIGGKFKVL